MKYLREIKDCSKFIHKFELKDKEEIKVIAEVTIDFLIINVKSKQHTKSIVFDKANAITTADGIKVIKENNILTIEVKKKVPGVIYELCIEIK